MYMSIDICKRADLIVTEVNRLYMVDVAELLRRNPDLYVIHYVRDPRGIALSRTHTGSLMSNPRRDIVLEAKTICQKLRHDLQHVSHLQAKYPGAFLQLRFEDLVEQPEQTANTAYQFINRTVPRSWKNFAHMVFHSNKTNTIFGATRQNGTEVVNHWKDVLSTEQNRQILDVCEDVLIKLKYPLRNNT